MHRLRGLHPECPVEAIKAEEDVPADQQKFVALNAELAKGWPSITRTKPQLAEADEWKERQGQAAVPAEVIDG